MKITVTFKASKNNQKRMERSDDCTTIRKKGEEGEAEVIRPCKEDIDMEKA